MNSAHEIELVRTCTAFPEQYDAFYDGEKVGYLRLRNGYFSVECPDCLEQLVYEAYPQGGGMFEDSERDEYLWKAKQAIRLWYVHCCGGKIEVREVGND